MIETQPKATAAPAPVRTERWVWICTLLVLLVNAWMRWRLRGIPLERDEGEFAYTGQLMLHGIPPYKLAYFMKLPGTHAAYAVIMAVFGQTASGIHLGLLVMNTATLIMVFFLGKRLIDATGGVIACAMYAMLGTSPMVLGFQAHATQFGVFFALAGLLTLYRAEDSSRGVFYFLSGALFGIAFLMKQPVLLFAVFGGLLIIWFESYKLPINWTKAIGRVAVYSLGVMIPYALTCLILWHAGVFDRFWYWTVTNVRTYGDRISLGMGYQLFLGYFQFHCETYVLFWLLGAVCFVLLLRDSQAGRGKPVILVLTLCSAVATSAGFYFRPHYFVLMLPALALVIAAGMASVRRLLTQPGMNPALGDVPVIAVGLVSLIAVNSQRHYLFRSTPIEACLYTYGSNPFTETPELAQAVAEHTSPDDRIVVLGSEPEIYFYSKRLSGTGYIYTYDMMAPNPAAKGMQLDFIREIKESKPKMLVMIKLGVSWKMKMDTSDNTILDWIPPYCRENYDLVGFMDFDQPRPRPLLWGADAASHPLIGTNSCLFVYQRKPGTTPN